MPVSTAELITKEVSLTTQMTTLFLQIQGTMKLEFMRSGARYEGPDGEIRTIVRMQQKHGGVVDLEWASENRLRNDKPAIGKSTPQLFAKWALRFAAADD